jgi:hypothetical protein
MPFLLVRNLNQPDVGDRFSQVLVGRLLLANHLLGFATLHEILDIIDGRKVNPQELKELTFLLR